MVRNNHGIKYCQVFVQEKVREVELYFLFVVGFSFVLFCFFFSDGQNNEVQGPPWCLD